MSIVLLVIGIVLIVIAAFIRFVSFLGEATVGEKVANVVVLLLGIGSVVWSQLI